MKIVEQLRELERAAFCAPWRSRAFEIDCPFPHGEDCGDLHTCCEVEAPEHYPNSPAEPAGEGDGQCVIQIDVPGLEDLSERNAAFIAAMRNALPLLLDVVAEAELVSEPPQALAAALARLAAFEVAP